MRDSIRQLKTAYAAALKGISYAGFVVPAYGQYAPNERPNFYIVFRPISNREVSPKSAAVLDTRMEVTVYTDLHTYNDGEACDAIANVVIKRITAGLTLESDQNAATRMESDDHETWEARSQIVSIDRKIVFAHRIYQRDEVQAQPDFAPEDFSPNDFSTLP